MSEFFDSVTNFFAKIGQIIAAIKGFFDTVSNIFKTLQNVANGFFGLITSWVQSYPGVAMLVAVVATGITIIILLSIWEAIS